MFPCSLFQHSTRFAHRAHAVQVLPQGGAKRAWQMLRHSASLRCLMLRMDAHEEGNVRKEGAKRVCGRLWMGRTQCLPRAPIAVQTVAAMPLRLGLDGFLP